MTRLRMSVVIPYYNAEEWVAAALASVLGQTRLPDEIIVVDDCSPMPFPQPLAVSLPPVTCHRAAVNGGVGAARALGTLVASGDTVSFLDADDWWEPRMLEAVEVALLRDPAAHGTFTGISVVRRDESRRVHATKPSVLSLRAAIVPPPELIPSCLTLRRDFLLQVGNWSCDRNLMDDWDLVIRCTAAGARIAGISEPLVCWRRFDHGNLSGQHWRMLHKAFRTIHRHRSTIRSEVGWLGPINLAAAAMRGRGSKQPGLAGAMLRFLGGLGGEL